jgi:hypothetical protein
LIHELVLNGIGGRTVEEAREYLTWDEVQAWAEYRRKRGSLHIGYRVEAGTALLAMLVSNALGGKMRIEDFMPHGDEQIASAEDVMGLFGRSGS